MERKGCRLRKTVSWGISLFDEVQNIFKRKKTLGLNELEYSVFLVIEEVLARNEESFTQTERITKSRELHVSLNDSLYPGWYNKATEIKNIERKVRKAARTLKSFYGLDVDDMNILYEKILERIKYFGRKHDGNLI